MHRSRSPRRTSIAGTIATLLIVILALAPAWQQLTLAQAGTDQPLEATETPPEPTAPPDTIPTEIPAQPTEIPTEPPVPTSVTEPPEPTAQAPPPELSDILNYVRLCPAGYEPATVSWSAFLADCPDSGEGFTLSVSAPAYPGQAGTSGTDGMVIFTGIPAGTVHLSQEPRDGFFEPYVFCAVEGAPQPVATPGLAFDYELPATQAATSTGASGAACFWFNTPLKVGDPGSPEDNPVDGPTDAELEVFKRFCPEGYDPGKATLDVLLADCDEPGANITFSLTGRDYGQKATTNAAGSATFTGIPAGEVAIAELTGGDYEVVVACTPANGALRVARDLPLQGPVTGPIGFEIPRDAVIIDQDGPEYICYVFNIPLPSSEMRIVKHLCAPDIEIGRITSLKEALAACPETGAGIGFAVAADGYEAHARTGEDGTVIFSDIPTGIATIEETLLDGYGEAVAWCGWTAEHDGTQFEGVTTRHEPTLGSLELEISIPGTLYTCDWFNVPLPDLTSDVVIDKHFCPPGIDVASATLQDLLSECADPGIGVGFAFAADGYERIQETGADGVVTFSDVPGDRFTVEEDPQDGYDESVVFCGWTAVIGGAEIAASPVEVTVYGYNLDLEIPMPGAVVTCDWFNIAEEDNAAVLARLVPPPGTGQLDIHSHLCPAGNDAATDLETLAAECSPAPGMLYYLAPGGPIADPQQLSNADGVATWLNMPGGPWTVYQNTPDGYLPGLAASCRYLAWPVDATGIDGAGFQPTPGLIGSSFSGDLPYDGIHLACDVYTFLAATPTETPGQAGTIDMNVLVCPPGHDLDGFEAEDEADCEPGEEGVGFTASDGAGYNDTATSGQNYRATFENAPVGQTIHITRDTPTATGTALVTCTQGVGELDLIPADAGIDVVIDPANLVGGVPYARCYWLTILPDDPEATEVRGTQVQDQPGQIDMHVAICPAGYTFENFQITMLGDCLPGETGITFTATDGGGYSESPPGSDGSWRVFFDSVPLDQPIMITRDVASGEGAPFATCDQGNGILNVVPADNGIQTTVETPSAGAPFERCIWFTVPSADPAAVTVNKLTCPSPAPDPGSATYADFLAACTEPGAGVTFHVYDTNVEGPLLYEATDASGHLAWEGAAGERFSVVEEVPAEYGEPVVFCTYGSAAVPDTTWERQPIEPGTHITSAFPLAPGYTWACHWFNIPAATGGATEVPEPVNLGEIVFDAFACPATGTVTFTSIDDLLDQCTAPQAGVTLTVRDEAAFEGNGTSTGNSTISILDIPVDEPLALTTVEPAGFEESILGCSKGELGLVPLSLVGGEYAYMVASTETCVWIGIPAPGDPTEEPTEAPTEPAATDIPPTDAPGTEASATEGATEPATTDVPTDAATEVPTDVPGTEASNDATQTGVTLTIAKFACPEGFAAWDASLEELAETCAEPQPGVEFGLDHAAGSVHGLTDSSGAIAWTDLPPGHATLQEYLPDGYAEPIIYCDAAGALERMDGPSTWAGVELTESGDYHCDVYNVPAPYPVALVIDLWTCPPGFDLHAYGTDPREGCAEPGSGVAFTLAGPDGETRDAVTNANGTARFDNLAAGGYTVIQAMPDGISSTFVLDCQGHYVAQLQPYPLVTGDTLGLNVRAGEVIACDWFNVPAEQQGRLTVIAYACATDTFVSDVDCEIFEDGHAFDLAWWNGDAWQLGASGTTDGAGRFSWTGLDPGAYWLDDRGMAWCHLASNRLSANGNWLDVTAGQETVVSIYHCGAGKPGTPGTTPLKYPNTGVPRQAATTDRSYGNVPVRQPFTSLPGPPPRRTIAQWRTHHANVNNT